MLSKDAELDLASVYFVFSAVVFLAPPKCSLKLQSYTSLPVSNLEGICLSWTVILENQLQPCLLVINPSVGGGL